MQTYDLLSEGLQSIGLIFAEKNAFRSVIILIISLAIAYWLSRFLADGIIKFAQIISSRGEVETNDQRSFRYQQIETYLSITVAVVRALVVLIVGFLAWQLLSPFSNTSIAAIGAGTIFIVFAGQTLGIILRDLTAGTVMITEQWFNVGDYIKVEPYWDVSGVVERFTLRSTRIRALNGEVIWIHNQNITGIHVVPKGVRTMSVDVFVRDKVAATDSINRIISAMPTGKTMLAEPLRIVETKQWSDNRWRIRVLGKTPPGREWLIENFFVQAVTDLDEGKDDKDKLLALPPMARYTDELADRRFRRAVRIAQAQEKQEKGKQKSQN